MGTIRFSLLPLSALNYSNSTTTPHLFVPSTAYSSVSSTFPFSPPSIFRPNREFHFGVPTPRRSQSQSHSHSQFCRNSFSNDEADSHETVEVLRVPEHWLEPSRALQESEWLRVSLHKWLDNEYCPEPTNIDISRIASSSYYQSLMQKTTDLGEILLRMLRELQTISYQESFHGAFSSANAAVALIAERIEHA